jgi:2-dehydro-3-deoxyglucarate aldolase/4-hydroxy-2-oxoheptanedioate aldolase
MKVNKVKRTLQTGGIAIGTSILEFATTGIARIAAAAGVDFVLFDMEHTGFSIETMRQLLATSTGVDVVPMVRVPATEYHFLARVLDLGAMGVMVPMVESAEQATTIVQSAKYPPAGRRGAAFRLAHDGYQDGDNVAAMRKANAEVLLLAQIESTRGVANADMIAAVDGIDVLWIGHNDLTNSLGIPGEFDHPLYHEAVRQVLEAARRHGKTAGFTGTTAVLAGDMFRLGFRITAYGGDVWIYQQGLRAGVAAVRAAAQEPSAS